MFSSNSMFIEGSAIMRKILKKLGDAELEMMCAVWELDRPFQRSELNPRLNKNWADTTVLTILSHLCDKQ